MLPKSEVDHADDLAQWVEDERAAIAQWEEAGRAAARDSLQAFTLRLNKRLAADADRSGNLVFSPLCLYAALSLWATGARERTLDELLGVLGVPSWDVHTFHVCTLARQALADRSQTGGQRINFGCGVWHDTTVPLRPAFRDVATEWYESVIRPVNFHKQPEEAKEKINAWVAALMNDLIPTLIGRDVLSHLTDLVLVNAMYFKGKWNMPFDEERHLFHRLDNTAIDTSFMRGFGRQRIAWHNGFKVLQLRYEQGGPLPAQSQPQPVYSMCVFLPDARDGLCWLANQIACDPDFLRKHLPRSDVEVDDFRLPTFKVSFDMTMNDILCDMGLKEALEPGKADLSDVVEDGTGGRRRLALQEVIHQAVIEVNEEGTEAAAATVMITCSTTSALPPLSRCVAFVADHPFAFFVIEEVSGAIMFAGHVVDPTIN
ncbi:serpin-Z6B-like [Triticum dicoccoides]|uniref:serpin-Z6B-like n=1 Tax=Triticum dicoccoides TaxID=85692 RepID=UPI0018909C21|nr:serpin-Z6B-like [Triticum dicoccoides]